MAEFTIKYIFLSFWNSITLVGGTYFIYTYEFLSQLEKNVFLWGNSHICPRNFTHFLITGRCTQKNGVSQKLRSHIDGNIMKQTYFLMRKIFFFNVPGRDWISSFILIVQLQVDVPQKPGYLENYEVILMAISWSKHIF